MLSVLFAVLAAAANALASVLQRQVAKGAPDEHTFRPSLILDLLRRPEWLGGIGALIAAFLLQAAALDRAGLALVQPLLAAELPFTMLLLGWLVPGAFRDVPWAAVGALTAGLAALLTAASPSEGPGRPGALGWAIATGVTAGLATGLIMAAWIVSGPLRAVLLGVTTSLGFALTAAYMKTATQTITDSGLGAAFTSWELYAMVATGVASLILLQMALASGTLVVVQPALTVTDPVASICLGLFLFDEHIRTGGWVALELAGIALILVGSIGIARSPVLHEQHTVSRAPHTRCAPRTRR
ncbi:DMT family transporter [Actinomadura nitritigenes]|uniref:DMT family transporter n=1 Tax=Actinomadura nitritigenes TaxID=134602 RepID=UPI003D8CA6A9